MRSNAIHSFSADASLPPCIESPTPTTNAGFSASMAFHTASYFPATTSPIRSPRITNRKGAAESCPKSNTAAPAKARTAALQPAQLIARFNDERRCYPRSVRITDAGGRHITGAARHLAEECLWLDVHLHLTEFQMPVRQHREDAVYWLYALLHHVRRTLRLAHRAGPGAVVMLVSDVAVEIRVIVVRPQHERLAILFDEVDQLDLLVTPHRLAGLHDAREGDVFLDRFAFIRREFSSQSIVSEQREHRFLVRKLGTEAVD